MENSDMNRKNVEEWLLTLPVALDVKLAVGCKINNLADGLWWNRVITVGGDHIDTAEEPTNIPCVIPFR